ncbi:TerB family tellurite resistance protein [Rivularia sp. UHCC 0363]|uniref:tellurite resistance TerB family protein n=1 Tax=Rivularia sp. UHCC 0363 TaxID=3110244 RepID=UPI002B1EECD7|nr:TerB family tellurite resistance protein [Rivularia sp. UHCC 0363]MEA5592896.1 TerB family tellurite resistance protein [Rivularia sp. UHCC 0363]
MISNPDVKKLLKILIAAAWIDGRIQPEERQYLQQIAKEKDIATDPEIKPWLYELVPVKPEECYKWVKEYLGNSPSTEDCQNLIQEIGGLIYSDGEVAIEEAKLLAKLQQLSDESESHKSRSTMILKHIQKLYRRWVKVQN